MTGAVEFVVPLKTKNPLNGAWGHWSAQAKKRSAERRTTLAKMPPLKLRAVLVVTLTRVSRGELDSDAVGPTLKSIRDAVAGRIGVDDRSPLVEWRYAQEKGEPCVRVRIENAVEP